jgi:hypothetical protein
MAEQTARAKEAQQETHVVEITINEQELLLQRTKERREAFANIMIVRMPSDNDSSSDVLRSRRWHNRWAAATSRSMRWEFLFGLLKEERQMTLDRQ